MCLLYMEESACKWETEENQEVEKALERRTCLSACLLEQRKGV